MTTKPITLPARQATTQQVNYVRKTINYNDANISSPTDPFACLPQGAVITNVTLDIETAFDAGTTNVLTVGTTAASANEIIAAADVDETVAQNNSVNRARGGSLCRSADKNLYVKYTQTGAAAANGKAHLVIEYVPNNDG